MRLSADAEFLGTGNRDPGFDLSWPRRPPRRFPRSHISLVLVVVGLVAVSWLGRDTAAVTGRVVFDKTGLPVAGARVGARGSNERVQTGADGRFRLRSAAPSSSRIVASKPGHFIAGMPHVGGVRVRLKKYPTEQSPDYEWLDPGPDPAGAENCANCHAEIYRQWSASSHARSAVNRHFLDVFYGTDWTGRPNVGWNFSRDHPEARAVCVACHVPTIAADSSIADDPARATGVVREGIHCDLCHKIAGADDSAIGLQHGRDALRLVKPAGGVQVFFGPLDDVDRGRDVYSPLYKSSLYCASCHEGTLFGTRAYETFSEWRASDYARRGVECQDCHMKPDGTTRRIATGAGAIDRDPASISTHHFAASIDESFLRSSVEIDVDARREKECVRATITVRPKNVGHCLPTGSPDRHLVLVVRATDAAGAELRQTSGLTIGSEGGVGSLAAGNLSGQPGTIFGKLLRGPAGESPAPFWRAVAVEKDSRLRPDEPAELQFTFDRSSDGPVRLSVSLIYRRFYKLTAAEKGWPDSDVTLAERSIQLP